MNNEIKIKVNDIILNYNIADFSFSIDTGYKCWIQDKEFQPYLEVELDNKIAKVFFKDAKNIIYTPYKTGFGEGVKISFSGFYICEKELLLSFETLVWIDYTYSDLHFELIPMIDEHNIIEKIAWPGHLEFNKKNDKSYTVLSLQQGTIIPNNWERDINIFDRWELEAGMFYTRSSTMPWWGQVEDKYGYMAIVETPWDGGFTFEHLAGGATKMAPLWVSSLGKIAYNRGITYKFFKECDYNKMCKVFRSYLIEKGELVTLEQKALKNHKVTDLFGAPVIHTNIYSHVVPISFYYDKENPDNNDVLVTFEKRAEQIKRLAELGVKKAFLHLDGWGKIGYDNQHPDVLPPCEKAGGWAGMKKLAEVTKSVGYLFAIHDQYRDYYLDADTYDKELAVHNKDGSIPMMTIWAGGSQTVLCTTFSSLFLKRNFEMLKQNGVALDGAYLDVFSCVGLDECFHNEHRMTRRECMGKRRECFDYVRSEGIIVSSEELIGWAMADVDIVHHGIYTFEAIPEEGTLCGRVFDSPIGIPVPLFNLVYHDCIVIPWFITNDKIETPYKESGILHALLNGGTSYIDIDADKEAIENAKIVCEFHNKIANKEMISHEFIDGDLKKQRTKFSDGTTVEVDFKSEKYKIL